MEGTTSVASATFQYWVGAVVGGGGLLRWETKAGVIFLGVLRVIMYASFRFYADDLINGSGALQIRLRDHSDPRLICHAFGDLLRDANFIVAIRRGRRLFYVRCHDGTSHGKDLQGFISVIVRRAKVNSSHVNYRELSANAKEREEAQLIRDSVPIEASATRRRIRAANDFRLYFMDNTFNFRVFYISVRSIRVLELGISVTRGIIPRREVVTFEVIFQWACVFIRVRDCSVLRESCPLFIRFSRVLMRTRKEETYERTRCG